MNTLLLSNKSKSVTLFESPNTKSGKLSILIPGVESRTNQKIIIQSGIEITLSQCSKCMEFKEQLFQYNTCSACLYSPLKQLIHVINEKRKSLGGENAE
jgi:hypothetical protein